MQNDQRLTPLPGIARDIQTSPIDFQPGAYPSSYEDSPNSRRSIKQYVNIVYKRLPIILAITILVTAAVAFYSFRLPPEFQASLNMIIEPRQKPQTAAKETTIINNFGDDQKYYNTQLQLLRDPALMKKAVIAMGLHRDATALGNQSQGMLGGLRSLFNRGQKADEQPDNSLPIVSDAMDSKSVTLTPEENRLADSYSATLAGGLEINQQPQTQIVNLTLKSSSALVAAKTLDKIAEIFREDDADRETNGAQTALKNLQKSINDLEAQVKEEENAYIETMMKSDLSLGDKGSEVRAADLQALIIRWREAQKDTGIAQSNYAAALEADRSGNILAVSDSIKSIQDERSQLLKEQQDLDKLLQDLDKKIDEKNQKKQELLVRYQPEYKEVRAVVAEIDELTKQRSRVADENTKKLQVKRDNIQKNAKSEVLAGLRAALTSAEQKEARLRLSVEQTAAKANIDGQAATKIKGQESELTSNRALLDTLRQREKEQALALDTDTPKNIKVQGNAAVPSSPIGPQRKRNILVALFLSLGAGIGLAFLLDFLDDSVRTSDDITRHLGLPTLALIPHSVNSDKRKLLGAGGNASGGVPATSSALIAMEERNSPTAEAYRHLRTSLLFSSAGKPPQIILVTSSQPSEGKTTTAINTAITLAQADVDVVIIDCDLRRPRLHSHFGMENTTGLTNYLSGDKNTENLMKTFKDLPRLKVITSGPIPPNPAELLSSNEMRNLLTFLSGRFKHIIVDSPPAISFTDASILSTLVDGVVLVAMANKSSLHLMKQFKQRVTAIGARIYGVVLNGIKANSEEYYYYGSGYSNYYSNPDDDESTPRMEHPPKAAASDTEG